MSAPTPLTPELLRGMPLPDHAEGADKNSRGRVLVIAGSREVPGAALLSALAALRAGAGKMQIAAPAGAAPHLAMAMPEALVTPLAETAAGGIDPAEADRLAQRCASADAVVLGPGMMDPPALAALTRRLMAAAEGEPTFILDAGALAALAGCRDALRRHAGRLVLTPHLGEMCGLLGCDAEAVTLDPLAAARRAAAAFGAVVDMKGGRSFVASPQGEAWACDRGNVGLATSGSGDTLAGIVAGLAARGAPPLHATLWGVFLHAEAGARLARRIGPVGYLAREIPGEVPGIMASLAG
jgi:ADP-dependent NAD(P)H-hydrate dehydratase